MTGPYYYQLKKVISFSDYWNWILACETLADNQREMPYKLRSSGEKNNNMSPESVMLRDLTSFQHL